MSEIETLRAAFRESVTGDDDSHLSDDQWERLACDEMAHDERQNVLDHIVECPLCSDTYRAIRIVRLESPAFDDAVPAPMVGHRDATVRRFPLRTLGLLALAATVMLAVALPMHLLRKQAIDDATMVVRSAGDEVALVPVSPMGTVVWSRGEDILVEWTLAEAPVSAFVEILDADGELVWTGPEVQSTEVVWPGEDIPGHGRYYWRVIIGDHATEVVDSELVSFDLSASHP
jgi:hypothetical protein